MFERFGFVGLGSQGAPMAQRMIDAGLPMVLWARRPETLDSFSRSSATTVETLAELAEQVGYVGICVVDDDGVREVCNQLIPIMRAGSCIAIHSTVNPELCKGLAIQAAERSIDLIDAPVSGGGPGAAAGTLTVMVGGDPKVLDSVRLVFKTFAGLIVHLGGVGAGQHAKLINNAMMTANLSIAYCGLQAATSLHLNREAFVDLINASSGRSFSFGVCARMRDPRSFAQSAKLLEKDVRLLGDVLDDQDSFLPLKSAAEIILELALKNRL